MTPLTLLIRKNFALSPYRQNSGETMRKSPSPESLTQFRQRRSPKAVANLGSVAVILGALLFGAIFGLAPSRAEAQCSQWDASGQWTLQQSNYFLVTVNLRQTGNIINGTANYGILVGRGTFKTPYTILGTVDGTTQGTRLEMQMSWDNGDVGVYVGEIDSQGKVAGSTYAKKDPKNAARKATWFKLTPLLCTSSGSQPPATAPAVPLPTPKPIKKIGNGGKRPPQIPAPTPFSDASVPRISANPKTINLSAGQGNGTTTLTWDGGADHPYAEVWVKVNDADEKFVVEKGKGTRTVNVQPGQTYTYILTDAGQRLATVTVKCN